MCAVETMNIAITVYLTTWLVDCLLLSNTNMHITKSVKYMPKDPEIPDGGKSNGQPAVTADGAHSKFKRE